MPAGAHVYVPIFADVKYKSQTPLYRATECHSNRLIISAAASMVQHASTLELAAHGHVPTVSHTIMFLDTSAMSRCTLLVWQGVDGWRETDV